MWISRRFFFSYTFTTEVFPYTAHEKKIIYILRYLGISTVKF